MPPTPPEVRSLLPSKAKQAVEDYLFQRIVEEGLHYNYRVRYQLPHALAEFREGDEYARGLLFDCYDRALKRFEKEYPLAAHPEGGVYRQGFPRNP